VKRNPGFGTPGRWLSSGLRCSAARSSSPALPLQSCALTGWRSALSRCRTTSRRPGRNRTYPSRSIRINGERSGDGVRRIAAAGCDPRSGPASPRTPASAFRPCGSSVLPDDSDSGRGSEASLTSRHRARRSGHPLTAATERSNRSLGASIPSACRPRRVPVQRQHTLSRQSSQAESLQSVAKGPGKARTRAVRRGYWCAVEPSLAAQNWPIGHCAQPVVNARTCLSERLANPFIR
jgi:hypothetical protein